MRASARFSVRDLSSSDLDIYSRVLPKELRLLDALKAIDWDSFVPELQSHYSCSGAGQPEYPPLILLKIEFLRYLYGFSARQAMERCQTDLLLKYFLQLPVDAILPNHSTLTYFRNRMGMEGFQRIFDQLITQARGLGLVKDKLRIKDATHIIADVAVPTTLGLLAQLRDRMIAAIKPFSPEAAEGFRVDLEVTRRESAEEDNESKLQGRLDLVQDILQWIIECPVPSDAAENKAWQKLQAVRVLAEKILADVINPSGSDKTVSVVDPDARRGKHGEYYDGYLLDVMIDADSELITSLDVLPANADEAQNAVNLIEHEEQAQGNDIEQLSIDGIGFNGGVLRTLSQADGLNVDVITPPRDFTTTEGFRPEQFELIEEGSRVKCPAGEVSGQGSRKKDKPNTTYYAFSAMQCGPCPLLPQCHPKMKPESRTGRRVSKNKYEAEYARARAKATTPEYAAVRQRHPAIERKLNELVRHHRARRATFRGRMRVKIQQLMTAMVVNVKRIVRLLGSQCAPARRITPQRARG